jgi:hypothetical protein
VSDFDVLREPVGSIAERIQDLQRQAAQQYKPIVDDILSSRSRDAEQIEHALDGLLDFCGYEPVLALYKQLCRHYWDIDAAATAYYINAFRERWDSDEQEGQP